MHTYRYYTIPILPAAGTQPVVELELSGVTMDKQLNGPGNFQGTYRFGVAAAERDALVMQGTVPGYHAIVCKRDGYPIWAGPIWTRTYESQGQTVNFNAQTFESVFERTPIRSTGITFINQAFGTIVDGFLDMLEEDAGTTFGITYLAPHWTESVPSGEPTGMSMRAIGDEFPFANEFLNGMAQQIQGHWKVVITPGSGDAIVKQLTYTSLQGHIISPAGIAKDIWDYPGTVSAYWQTETTNGGGRFHVAKYGNTYGTGTSLVQPINDPKIGYPTTFWPKWMKVTNWPNLVAIANSIFDAGDLAFMAAGSERDPRWSYVMELTDAGGEVFNQWNELWTYFYKFHATDPRWPLGNFFNGAPGTSFNLLGWSLNPGSSETPEILRLEGTPLI